MLLAPEIHVLDDVEVVAEGEILIDDLDAKLGGVLRPVDAHRLVFEVDLALIDGMDPGDTLDQRRLAGAVVADERHHLAGADLEVDVSQSLNRAERLRDAPKLERRNSVAHDVQYFAYWPMHTWLFFRKPSVKSRV